MENATHRVVVVGGGFGGLRVVAGLRGAPVEVTLVDRRNFHLFQPLTYQVATGALSPGEITYPLRAIFKRQRNVRVLLAEVRDFDLDARVVRLGSMSGVPTPEEVQYDSLVVAGGSAYSYFGHDDWRAYGVEVKSIESALAARGRLLAAFEAAEATPHEADRYAWLTFVVVGGGPTGVEMAGQIGELALDTLRRDFRNIDPRSARILLVEATDRVLTSFPPSLSSKAERSLQRLGVTVLTGRTVVGIDDDGVTLADGDGATERVASRVVIWAAGVTASGLAGRLGELTGAERDRAGRVTVEPDLTLPGHAEVFAIGDMVRVRDSNGEAKLLPGVAPVAMQQGRHAARVILPLPRQGQPGDDRPRRRRCRHPRAQAERLPRLDDVAPRPPLVPDRLPEPPARAHPLERELPHARARSPVDRHGERAALAARTYELRRGPPHEPAGSAELEDEWRGRGCGELDAVDLDRAGGFDRDPGSVSRRVGGRGAGDDREPEVDAVAVEDPREAAADDAADPAALHRERDVLPRRADAEVRSDDEDRPVDHPLAQRGVEALEEVLRHLRGILDVQVRARVHDVRVDIVAGHDQGDTLDPRHAIVPGWTSSPATAAAAATHAFAR